MTDTKKVSSAHTHFCISTAASEWAQDCQKTALSQTPVDFSSWADFKTAFDKHFVPVITTDLAQQNMFNMKQGACQFNEWYQEWSTFAAHSGANEDTKIYVFKRNLNNGIHQKLLGVSPTPTTLADLVSKACEFDRTYEIYQSQNPQGPHPPPAKNHNLVIDDTQINATVPQRPKPFRKLTAEEKDHCFKNKLCPYCGKPGHMACACQKKQEANTKPCNPVTTRTTTTQEEAPLDGEDDSSSHVASLYHDVYAGTLPMCPFSAPIPPVPGDTIRNIQSPSIVLRVTLVGHKSGKEISAKALLDRNTGGLCRTAGAVLSKPATASCTGPCAGPCAGFCYVTVGTFTRHGLSSIL